MRLLGPSDMLSVATHLRDGMTSVLEEFSTLGALIHRGGVFLSRAEALLGDAEALLARATATLAQAESTLRGASATVAEAAAGSLMASKALHDTQELLRRTDAVLGELETSPLPEVAAAVAEAHAALAADTKIGTETHDGQHSQDDHG